MLRKFVETPGDADFKADFAYDAEVLEKLLDMESEEGKEGTVLLLGHPEAEKALSPEPLIVVVHFLIKDGRDQHRAVLLAEIGE